MGRLQRSWSILKSSFSILSNNRKLLFFPEGLIPEQYSQGVLETAWKTKKK